MHAGRASHRWVELFADRLYASGRRPIMREHDLSHDVAARHGGEACASVSEGDPLVDEGTNTRLKAETQELREFVPRAHRRADHTKLAKEDMG